jgi:hypothetical protein
VLNLFWFSYRSIPYVLGPVVANPDLAIFVIDLQNANKKLIFSKFFCLFLFEGTFKSFFTDGKPKEVTKQTVGIKVA